MGPKDTVAKRDSFSGRFGFILACVGSAVGIGNVWLFPWRIGEFGGAIFLLQYFVLVFLVGVVGLIGEFTLGRLTRSGPIGAFEAAFKSRGLRHGALLGTLPALGALGIGIGYAIVVGWILRYVFGAIDGSMFAAPNIGAYFGALVGDFGSLPWHFSALFITLFIMLFGINAGIEKANKIMMPLFYILFVILLVRVLTLPNISEGIAYLLVPKWEVLANPKAWAIALGQAFFSLSLAGSGMVVYGSYLPKNISIVSAARQTAIYSSIGALLCAFVIMPAVFACGVDPTAGPPLIFLTLPVVFKLMPFGQVFAVLFFISVLFAALTSLMNLLECPIEALQSRLGLSRTISVLLVGVVALGVGAFIESASMVGAWMDILSIYIVPLGATLAGIVIFWVFGMRVFYKEVDIGASAPLPRSFTYLSKYLFCSIAILIVVLSVLLGGL